MMGEHPPDGQGERDGAEATAKWGVPLLSVHCSHCGEDHLVPPAAIPARCPLCHHGGLAPLPAVLRDEEPEQTVPFSISEERATALMDEWTRGGWFRPTELRAGILARRMQRYWIPLWLVDADVKGAWRAQAGFDYDVVSHQDRYADGAGWRSREVTETRVRWEPRAGHLDRRYENVVAPALDDHRAVMDRIGKYDLGSRTNYSPGSIGDSAVRVPTLSPEAAWPLAEPAFVRAAEDECRVAAGAEHIREFTLRARFPKLKWTQLLLPAYTTWYAEGGQVWPVLINGQNGRIHGVRRASTRRANSASFVIGGLALALFVLGALAAAIGVAVPLLVVVGGTLLIAGVVLALVAPVPAISARVRNRRSSPDGSP